MAKLTFNVFPGGKRKALTMSYDDGMCFDRKLVDIFNKNGIRGTFHLNSGKLGTDGYIGQKEVAALYKGHEVAAHTVNHFDLTAIPENMAGNEIQKDRENLEDLVGYPVRGMSYPFGRFNQSILKILHSLGIEYCRTASSSYDFRIAPDFLRWDSTCHHTDHLLETGKRFLQESNEWTYMLLYVWGHSFEFDRNSDWNLIESFCKMMGGRDDIWYATNIEIVDYINAVRGLRFTADGQTAFNPSYLDVWVDADGKLCKIASGSTVHFS